MWRLTPSIRGEISGGGGEGEPAELADRVARYSGASISCDPSVAQPDVVQTGEPEISEEGEYAEQLGGYNPSLGGIFHDVLRVDLTEMERPLLNIAHASDQWAYAPDGEGVPRIIPRVPSSREFESNDVLEKTRLENPRNAYVSGRMMVPI